MKLVTDTGRACDFDVDMEMLRGEAPVVRERMIRHSNAVDPDGTLAELERWLLKDPNLPDSLWLLYARLLGERLNAE